MFKIIRDIFNNKTYSVYNSGGYTSNIIGNDGSNGLLIDSPSGFTSNLFNPHLYTNPFDDKNIWY